MLVCCRSLRALTSKSALSKEVQQSARVASYATRNSRFSNDNASSGGHKLTLEHFVLRSKSIKLFRDFLRATRNIPNPEARRQTVDWLRDEHFEGRTGLKYEYDLVRRTS